MPAWISGIQGIREILNSAGTALTRRKQLQFAEGFTAADDGTRTVVTLGAPSSGHSAAVATAIRGVGLTVDSTNKLRTRTRPRRAQMQDLFDGGNTTSGSIGTLGWNLLGSGTPAVTKQNAALSGRKLLLTTSGATNDRSSLLRGESETRQVIGASEFVTLQCNWDHNNVLTNQIAFFGFSSDFSANPGTATSELGIYYDSSASPNYQIILRVAGVGSPVVTAVAVPANTGELISMFRNTTTNVVDFRIGNTSIGSIDITTLVGTNLPVGFKIRTLENAAKTLRIGGFWLNADTAGVTDDDTFLET